MPVPIREILLLMFKRVFDAGSPSNTATLILVSNNIETAVILPRYAYYLFFTLSSLRISFRNRLYAQSHGYVNINITNRKMFWYVTLLTTLQVRLHVLTT